MKKNHLNIQLIVIFFVIIQSVGCKSNDPTNDKVKITYGSMSDQEGNTYKTIKIGTQTWMAENLKVTKYNDGSSIELMEAYDHWKYMTVGAYCYYDYDNNNVLYNWYTVKTGKLAPIGWHVPTIEEWSVLENYLIANGYNFDGKTTGNTLGKSLATTDGWAPTIEIGTVGKNPETNNSSGFSATASGTRDYYGVYSGKMVYCCYWSSSAADSNSAYIRILSYMNSSFSKSTNNWINGLAVRCVKNN